MRKIDLRKVQTIREMWEQKLPDTLIAEKLEISRVTVRNIRKRFGMKTWFKRGQQYRAGRAGRKVGGKRIWVCEYFDRSKNMWFTEVSTGSEKACEIIEKYLTDIGIFDFRINKFQPKGSKTIYSRYRFPGRRAYMVKDLAQIEVPNKEKEEIKMKRTLMQRLMDYAEAKFREKDQHFCVHSAADYLSNVTGKEVKQATTSSLISTALEHGGLDKTHTFGHKCEWSNRVHTFYIYNKKPGYYAEDVPTETDIKRYRWTQEEIDKLKRLWEEGQSDEDIAKTLRRTVSAVKKKASGHHLGRRIKLEEKLKTPPITPTIEEPGEELKAVSVPTQKKTVRKLTYTPTNKMKKICITINDKEVSIIIEKE